MKKSVCIPLAFAFILLFGLSCREEPTSVQTVVAQQEGSEGMLGKPGQPRPTCWLNVAATPVILPGEKAVINYGITASDDITEANISIIYDDNQDDGFEILFSERVYTISINCDGFQTSLTGTVTWDGTVFPHISKLPTEQNPMIFDHRGPADNPDHYLLSFQVIAGGMLTYNWTSPSYVPNKILVSPTQCPSPFNVESITADKSPASSRKGKYSAALTYQVVCSQPGFTGGGQWQQSTDGGITWGGLTNYDGCPNCQFQADASSNSAGSTCVLLVGPGTYRFTLKLLYNPLYYYAPNGKILSNVVTVLP